MGRRMHRDESGDLLKSDIDISGFRRKSEEIYELRFTIYECGGTLLFRAVLIEPKQTSCSVNQTMTKPGITHHIRKS